MARSGGRDSCASSAHVPGDRLLGDLRGWLRVGAGLGYFRVNFAETFGCLRVDIAGAVDLRSNETVENLERIGLENNHFLVLNAKMRSFSFSI